MVGAHPFVNLCQQFASLFLRNAPKLHPAFTPPIEIPIYQDVHLCLIGYAFGFFFILWKNMMLQTLEQFNYPSWHLFFHGQDYVLVGE